jgi:predicted nucleic acid-binding protein
MDWAKTRYLDASALVKLVIDEDHHIPVREYFKSNIHFATTSLCLVEALGVLKGKWLRHRISEDQYFSATHELVIGVVGKKIEVDEINLFSLEGIASVEALAKKYGLDLSDALQLETILRGKYSPLGPNSSSILITADAGLTHAAQAEGIRVWNCAKTDPPSWA